MSNVSRHAAYHLTHRTNSGDTTIDYPCMRDVLSYLRDLNLLGTRTIHILVDDRTRKDSIAKREYTAHGYPIPIPTEEEFLASLKKKSKKQKGKTV